MQVIQVQAKASRPSSNDVNIPSFESSLNTEPLHATTTSPQAHADSENCLAAGTRLNDFEITGVLGEGGFGIVYLAFDHSLQRTVAIKEYMPGTLAGRAADGRVVVRAERHQATFDTGLRSFINEARLLAQFDHPSLVKVYRFWEKNQTAYMAMRHYQGDTLKDIVSRRPELITEAWLKFIFKQILEALDTLYKAKILHRDVSPDNIIVQKNGDAVLLDFGSARQIIGDMTQGLTVILKPGYAPVEQYSDDDGLQQGPWTDIYALAAVMYFMIVRTPPPMAVARIVKDTMLPLHEGDHPGYSEKFLLAVDKGLAIQPQERPQSMDEFRRLLGISAFVSARNSRSGGAMHDADNLAEAEQIAHLAHIRNAPINVSDTEAKVSANTRQDAADHPSARETGQTRLPGKPARLAAAGGFAILLGLGTYFFTQRDGISPEPERNAVAVQLTPSADDTGKENPAQGKLALDKLSATTAATAANTQEQSPHKTNVKLSIKPWGSVIVDGVENGASPPLKVLHLAGGKHQIRVTNPGFPDFVTEIDAGKKKNTLIEHEFTTKK